MSEALCFVSAFHTFVTSENPAYLSMPSSWPVVITVKKTLAGTWKKKCRRLAGPNEWQQVCNRSNPEGTGRSCEGADFSGLSSKVSRTLEHLFHSHSFLDVWWYPIISSNKVSRSWPNTFSATPTSCGKCKLAISARWLGIPNRVRGCFPHNLRSAYGYLILYFKLEDLYLNKCSCDRFHFPQIISVIEFRMVYQFWIRNPYVFGSTWSFLFSYPHLPTNITQM